MKIAKSELQKIINEEIQDVLIEEGFMGDAWSGAKSIGREFIKGFMGTGARADNPLSRGVHRAFGSTLVPKIDKLLIELTKTLKELDEHPESDAFKGQQRDTGERGKGGKKKQALTQPNVIKDFGDQILELSQKWFDITRGQDPAPTPSTQPAPDDPSQLQVAEVIRRMAREEIKRHFTS
jgi:hypothetical protein